MSGSNRGQIHMQNTLAALQTRGDHFTRQLVNEKQRVARLQAKLNQVNQNIANVRESNKQKAIILLNKHANTAKKDAYTRADGLNPTRTAITNQRKMVKSMEGRLNKALVRRNSIETENNAVKEKIGMLRSKICNDNINRACMEKELKQIQERMDDIMRRAAVASEQTDKVVDERNRLLGENLEEGETFNEEYERLGAYVAEQARLLGESIATVANDVVASADGGNRKNGGGTSSRATNPAGADADSNAAKDGADVGVDPVEEIRQLQEKMERLDADYYASSQHLKATDERIEQYKENLKLLQQVSGLQSIDDIIDAFVKHEDESFSLFSYIQAINQEIDDTTEENARLENELEAYTKDQTQQENQRAAVVSKYKDILKEAEEERRKMNAIAREGRQTVQKIAAKVQGLYFKLRCRQLEQMESSSSSSQLNSGDNNNPLRPRLQIDRKLTMTTGEEISENNILHHMELIERRTCEIIAAYAKRLASSKKSQHQRRPSVILSPKMFQLQRALATAPEDDESDTDTQSDEESSDEDEYGGRPMSVHDMRLQAAEKIRPQSASTPIASANKLSTMSSADVQKDDHQAASNASSMPAGRKTII